MFVLNITKITLAWELYEAGIPKSHIASRLGMQRETVHLWIKGILEYGLVEFMDRYSKAKKGPRIKRQVDPILKRWVWEIREREMDCCGQKIIYFLEKEHGVSPALSKVYEILAEKYVIKSKWKHNQVRGAVPHAVKPTVATKVASRTFVPARSTVATVAVSKAIPAKPTATPVATTVVSGSKWTVQVATYKSEKYAQQEALGLKGKGYPTFIVKSKDFYLDIF